MNETRQHDVSDDDVTDKAFAAALRVEIARAQMSNNEVAKTAGISQGLMSSFVNGRQSPRLVQMYALAGALGITINELWDSIETERARLLDR